MRWSIPPLVAALLLTGSGFLDSLERTTEASLALSEASLDAPRTTAEAAEELAVLPQIADVTEQQASAMRALADALEGSAQRVRDLDSGLDRQSSELRALQDAIDAIRPDVTCVRARLERLVSVSAGVPSAIGALGDVLEGSIAAQNKSIRHMRSINRKLTALGVVAAAQEVEAPPPPGTASAPGPGDAPPGKEC